MGTRRKLAEGIGGLSGVHRELVRGDRELARKASGVRRKKTKRLVKRLWGLRKACQDWDWRSRGKHFSKIYDGYIPNKRLYHHHAILQAAFG
ncbi:hypothetical protein B296_00030658 [Ensete ventricosum]|uniref:Uncharacterized protein n=1 Tax=Ensete ventricosum TaxID=4639 RepID=A0A427AIH0_ENSVE|nr:hypothetical protein B296_00030658 [Ensete ventricosum]